MRTGNRVWLAGWLVAVSAWPGVAVAASGIAGTVTFDGKAPVMKALAMDADPVCAKKHTKPALNEMLVLGSGNTMGNVMVYVSKGLPPGKTYPAPKTPVTLRDGRSAQEVKIDGNNSLFFDDVSHLIGRKDEGIYQLGDLRGDRSSC